MRNTAILSIMEKFNLRAGVYIDNKFAGSRDILKEVPEYTVENGRQVVITAFNRDATRLTFNQRVDIDRMIPEDAGFEFTGYAFQYVTGDQVDAK